MFRKLTLSAFVAAAALTGLSLTPTAAVAGPPAGVHHRYEVLVRHGRHWDVRGEYHTRFQAERAADRLRHEGYRVRVRES